MVSTRRSKNSDGDASTVTVGSIPHDTTNSTHPMKQLHQLPTKVTTSSIPRHGSSAAAAAAPKVLAIVVAKSGSTVNKNNSARLKTTVTSATSTSSTTKTAKLSIKSQKGGPRRRKVSTTTSSFPVKKTTTTKKPSCWKKGRAGISNRMLQLQKNPNVKVIQYQTGVLYLHVEGNHRRAEYVQTK